MSGCPRLPPLASRALAPRHGRRHRDRPAHVPDVPTHGGGGAASGAPGHARDRRGRRGGGGRRSGPLVRARPRPRRPRRRRSAPPRRPGAATLLSPFDSLLWHRERVARLLGYDYRIEVYVPAPAAVRLLCAARAGRRPAHRAGGHQAPSRRAATGAEAPAPGALVRSGQEPPAASWGPVSADRGLAGLADAARSLAAFTGADGCSEPRDARAPGGRRAPGIRRAPGGDGDVPLAARTARAGPDCRNGMQGPAPERSRNRPAGDRPPVPDLARLRRRASASGADPREGVGERTVSPRRGQAVRVAPMAAT